MEQRANIQESQYIFPYHYLTSREGGVFALHRHLQWGLVHYSYTEHVAQLVAKLSGTTVLDAGCGDGRMTAELLRRKPERDYTGVDISERALSFARAFNPNVDFHVHNLSEGPAGKQYDICVSVEVIEHIPPELVGAYVEHVAGSLVAGGQFVLTTPTTNQPTHRKHYQHFTLDALREHLEPHFIIDHVEYLNVENRLANILGRLLANKYFLITNIRVRNTLYALYKKHCFRGKKTTGTRILIRATKA